MANMMSSYAQELNLLGGGAAICPSCSSACFPLFPIFPSCSSLFIYSDAADVANLPAASLDRIILGIETTTLNVILKRPTVHFATHHHRSTSHRREATDLSSPPAPPQSLLQRNHGENQVLSSGEEGW